MFQKKKVIFFSMWDLKPISIYILCSQEKNYAMFTRKKLCYVHKKKTMFFQCGI